MSLLAVCKYHHCFCGAPFWWLLLYAESPKFDLKDTEEACLPEDLLCSSFTFSKKKKKMVQRGKIYFLCLVSQSHHAVPEPKLKNGKSEKPSPLVRAVAHKERLTVSPSSWMIKTELGSYSVTGTNRVAERVMQVRPALKWIIVKKNVSVHSGFGAQVWGCSIRPEGVTEPWG